MKIGIFGGSFNPPHIGHIKIATDLINNKLVNKVIFVPTGNRYNKKELIDCNHRYNMLKIICEENNNMDVSDYEQKNELIYAYQTLDNFQKMFPKDQIYLIIGADNLLYFETWREYRYILSNYKVIINTRDNIDVNKIIEEKFNEYKDSFIIRETHENISSTSIRDNIVNINEISPLLTQSVLNYIKENNLYQ